MGTGAGPQPRLDITSFAYVGLSCVDGQPQAVQREAGHNATGKDTSMPLEDSKLAF